jgi:carboxymethylenebutenolidase
MSNKKLTAQDFHPEVLKLFDQYVHGFIARRDFLARASKFTLGVVTAEGLLQALSPRFAEAQQVKPDDNRIVTSYVEHDSPNGYGKVRGYLAKPANAKGKLPVVLVVHENRGLNPHIEDIARRLALENFIAFAPDALFPLGGYPGDEDKARALFPQLDQNKTRADFIASTNFIKSLPEGNGKFGVTGFCYGGGISNFLATKFPDLGAAVPFYGAAPASEDVAKIKAQVLIHHGSKDERLLAAWPKYEEALKAAGVKYEAYIYANAEHGFNNDTTPRYDEASAKLAWKRTVDLFNKTLRA